jgi:hypothetical protein
MDGWYRAGGLVAEESCVQVVPLKIHVSLRATPVLPSPPKRTISPAAGS